MPVISVENVSKRYRLGQVGVRTLREDFTNLFKKMTSPSGKGKNFIWALKDVNFEVNQGERLGIIGPNGAGKTTMLRILAGITSPTQGRVSVTGSMGVLIELMAGFHAELTGRENVYLNGSIMGMSRKEIARKFDEIVAFAELEDFIDTPIKRYSSGMNVRLGFAVASHLEPEVLIVDEVLAVGDYRFQKKCLGKMGGLTQEGKTVVFVSHNMASILNLCPRSILLDKGKVVMDGNSSDVVEYYIAGTSGSGGEMVWPDPATAPGNDKVRLHAVRILSNDDKPTDSVDIQKDIYIQISYWNFRKDASIYSAIHLMDQFGTYVLASTNRTSACLTPDPWYDQPHPTGLFQSVCRLPGNFLNEGIYSINAIVGYDTSGPEARADNVVSFRVHDTGAMRKEYMGGWLGVVRPRLDWHTEYQGDLDSKLDSHEGR